MKIFGVGTDIVKTNRIQRLLKRKNILEKLFNKDEIIKCKRIKIQQIVLQKIYCKGSFF